jgi:hypothetical protein
MRRLVFSIIMASGLVMVGPSLAFADEPAPTVSVAATPGKKLCKVADKKLEELSGIVATKTGYIAVNDSTNVAANKKIFFLNTKCQVTNQVSFSGGGPRDPEDLILSPNGQTLWIADIGDNNYNRDERRENLTLWKMPANGSAKPTIHRVAYPAGDNHDAEALLLNGDGTPLIVTREFGKPAYVYQPTKPLQTNNETGVPLKRVAQITVSATETPGSMYGRLGNKSISGGAVAPGGGKVVLRTYTDALEWDVTGGNVIAALQQKPRTTALPNEPSGEAITYTADGKSFLTVSDMNGDTETANYIQQYTPATTVAAVKKSAGDSGASSGAAWYADLTLGEITAMVGGVGVFGLILVGVGVLGIVRHRKRLADEPPAVVDDFENPLDGEKETELLTVGGTPQPAGLYGAAAARSGPAAGGGGVYGGAGAQPAGRNGVYGAPKGQPARPVRGPQGQPAGAPQGQPMGAPQGQTSGAPQGQPPRGPQGQPPRGPQGRPPRGPNGQPLRGPNGQPARGPQGQPARGPQGQPPRGPGGQPPRGPQGQPPGAPQGQPARGPQGQPARGPQGQPPRGPGGQPPRGPQGQPPRGPQGQPARGPQGQPPRGGQPARGPQGQPPTGGQGQPARGPQGQPPRGPGGQPPRGPQGQPPRGGQPARGPQGQPPTGGQGQPPRNPQGQPRNPQGQPRNPQAAAQRPPVVHGPQPAGRSQGDGYADYNRRPDRRFEHPGHGHR